MAMEAVANIFLVGNSLYNSVFGTELFDLKATQILRRRTIDCIQIAILFFIFLHLFVDMLQYFQCKSAILYQ